MNILFNIESLLNDIRQTAKKDRLDSGFIIGSTAKKTINDEFYLTPLRNTGSMIVGGVIVFNEQQAMHIARKIDGKVDYVLVDAEKKIPPSKFDFSG